MSSVVKLPIPFMAALYKLFIPNMNNFPDPDDYERWEAFSPVALTDLFCSPILIAHFTSDTLVPIDQISKRFTYDKPGDSLPEDFNSRLPESYPGKLKYSLEERLPQVYRVECLDAEVVETEGKFRFDADKRFNLNIYDDGPVEGFGSHRSTASTGRVVDTDYLETLLSRTAAKTNILTPEKLRSFLERYQGKSVQLPAHEGIDDEVYGSLNIYRKEVIEHLAYWTNNNGNKALNEVFEAVLKAEDNEDCRKSLQVTFDEIINSL